MTGERSAEGKGEQIQGPKARRAVLALVATVFVLPMIAIAIIVAFGVFEGEIQLALRNASGVALREVKLTFDEESVELGGMVVGEMRPLERELGSRVAFRVEHQSATDPLWKRSEVFTVDAGMGELRLVLVFGSDESWDLEDDRDAR